ncbi:MFS transporter [Rhodococcus opacus]|uniref:MFS transporter n=1 Tax=Rhodococcus opacus TaxID=37919 RepID=UPI0002A3D9BD|nr:MFS transporter [Rhodococcus opacus]ELB89827.1 multidrug ABC transporter [Rhodococcus wratislaviensis IFP 2016]MDX5965195.1 MFS transporter [Rhodococcus opacus]NKY74510.1 MFS transporter [Rhodococcus opacus]CAG7619805.1 putative MFS-type transporter EfpA [Rhodococcus opacus]
MTTAVSGRATATPAAVLGIILASYFMVLLDNSVIFTGLPRIRSGLELSPAALSWVQDAYTLVFGGLLLLASRAGDIVGRRRLFRIGLAIFGTASLLIGLAPAGWWMIAARAVQGIGAAIVAPTSLALITTYFDGEARNKAIAWYAATAGIGASLGLLVGGALTEWISWRAAFLVNVPIAVALIAWSRTVLVETPRRTGRFDVIGAVGATLGMGAVIFGIIESPETGWGSARVQIALALGAVLLIGLVVHEGRVQQPILPLRLFRSRERSGAYTARLLYLGAMIGFFYFTTQLLQDGFGFSPLQAGLGFLPMTLVNFVVALMVPRLSARLSNETLLATGTALTLAGMAWLSRIDTLDTYLVDVALPMILVGAGQGLAFGPLTNAGIAGVDSADAGAASGLVNTAHQLGMALGLGVLVALSANTGSNLDGPAAVTDHVGTALTGGTVLLVVALVVVLTVIVPAARHRGSGSALHRPAA